MLDSDTGTVVRELPIGTPASDWSRYYIVTQLSGSAQLKAIDPASGRTIAQATIPASYSLPDIAFQGPTAGISPNGQWLVLTQQGASTNFLVGSSSLTDSFKTIHVNGDFVFDALSNDGKSLYLIQKMTDPNHYQVRLYDVAAGALMPQPVVDKREPNEPMNGIRGDSAADSNGNYVYTVYIRDGGPFILSGHSRGRCSTRRSRSWRCSTSAWARQSSSTLPRTSSRKAEPSSPRRTARSTCAR